MNFAAHAYLSFNDDAFLFGNFTSDFLDRSLKKQLSGRVKEGLEAHAFIDEFTDRHASFKFLKKQLFPTYGHYSSVVIDLFYDYCLVSDWRLHS